MIVVIAVDRMSIHNIVQNANALMGEMEVKVQHLLLKLLLEFVAIWVGLVMVFVMIQQIIRNVVMMVETAVDTSSIHNIVYIASALMGDMEVKVQHGGDCRGFDPNTQFCTHILPMSKEKFENHIIQKLK